MKINKKDQREAATVAVLALNSWETRGGTEIVEIVSTDGRRFTGLRHDWEAAGIDVEPYGPGELLLDVQFSEYVSGLGSKYLNFVKVRKHNGS